MVYTNACPDYILYAPKIPNAKNKTNAENKNIPKNKDKTNKWKSINFDYQTNKILKSKTRVPTYPQDLKSNNIKIPCMYLNISISNISCCMLSLQIFQQNPKVCNLTFNRSNSNRSEATETEAARWILQYSQESPYEQHQDPSFRRTSDSC